MAITTAVCNQFKADVLGMAVHAAGNAYKLVLIKSGHGGTYGAGTISVGATVDGTGTPSTTLLGTDAISASNSTMGTYGVTGFALSGFSATLQTATGKTLAAYDFGGTVASTAGNFTISVPAVGASTSMIRIA
jgi:hypothetical protein